MTPYERAYDVMNRVSQPGWGDEITMAVADAIEQAVIEEREGKEHGFMIDTNELRAAAERLSNESYNSVEHAEMYEQPLQRARDAMLLARAYLAELEPNDYTDAARPSYWRGNDDGVRRACERITAILDGKDNGSGVCGEPLETLRQRLLAGHPADDVEPVTHKQLRNVGFTRGMQAASSNVLTLWSGKNYVSVDIEKDGFVRVAIGDSDIAEYLPAGFSMQTMGDIRRLCAALGIELKEGVA